MMPVDSGSNQSVSQQEEPAYVGQIEGRLREASLLGRSEVPAPDLSRLMQRARREVGLRDVVGFGFAHLLTTMLALVATVFNRAQAGPVRRVTVPAPEPGEGQA